MIARQRLAAFAVLFCVFIFRDVRATTLPPEPARNVPFPAWYHDLDCAPSKASREPARTSAYGVEYLLVDKQVDLASKSTVSRCVYRICSDSGLQGSSNFVVDFDPSYETIRYQHVLVWRDGVARDVLKGADIQLIQQEKDLERFTYNGRISSLIVIPDLRVGDVIDFAYTRTGWNPVFGGKYAEDFVAGWTVPVRREHVSILAPAARTLSCRSMGDVTLKLSVTPTGGEVCYEWDGRNLAPVVADDGAPDWYLSYGYIDVSEFASWSEVADWADRLFRVKKPDPAIEALAAKLWDQGIWDASGAKQPPGSPPAFKNEPLVVVTAPDAGLPGPMESGVLAIVDFVQRQVRYMGVEMGPHSHQPADPGVVLRRRYGDCKDKARLLCALLNAKGIEAVPVLVSTWHGSHVNECIPSPNAFNHAIVRIGHGGFYYYVDATQTFDRGGLAFRGVDRGTNGLVVDRGVRDLTWIPPSDERVPRIRMEETVQSTSYSASATETVRIAYSGSLADQMREYCGAAPVEELKKTFFNLFKEERPNLEPTSDFQWYDDPAWNRVVVLFSFEIPDFWTKASAGSENVKAEVWPLALRKYIQQPKSLVRTAPLRVTYPLEVEQRCVLHMPDRWTLDPQHDVVEARSFRYTHELSTRDGSVVISDHWRSLSDEVPVEALRDHVDKLAEVRRVAEVSLTKDLDYVRALKNGGIHWLTLVWVLAGLAAAGSLAYWLWRPSPGLPPVMAGHPKVPIGGWLLLPVIGLWLGLLLQVVGLVGELKSVGSERVWLAVAHSPRFAHAHWGLWASVEAASMTFLLALDVATIVMVIARKRGTPTAFMTLLSLRLVYQVFEAIVQSSNAMQGIQTSDTNRGAFVISTAIAAAVWCSYFLKSKRVERTFVR